MQVSQSHTDSAIGKPYLVAEYSIAFGALICVQGAIPIRIESPVDPECSGQPAILLLVFKGWFPRYLQNQVNGSEKPESPKTPCQLGHVFCAAGTGDFDTARPQSLRLGLEETKTCHSVLVGTWSLHDPLKMGS